MFLGCLHFMMRVAPKVNNVLHCFFLMSSLESVTLLWTETCMSDRLFEKRTIVVIKYKTRGLEHHRPGIYFWIALGFRIFCNMFLVQVSSRLLGSLPVVCSSSFVRNMDNQSNDGYSVRFWGGKNWWSLHSKIGMHIWMRSHICVIMVCVISWVFIEHRRLVHESPWCARLLHWSHSEWTCECCNALTMCFTSILQVTTSSTMKPTMGLVP